MMKKQSLLKNITAAAGIVLAASCCGFFACSQPAGVNKIEMRFERQGASDYSPFQVYLTATNSLSVKTAGLDVKITA